MMNFISYKKYINEKFTKDDSDPIHDMGIGLKHQIMKWLNEEDLLRLDKIKDMYINNDLTIDAKDVDISWEYLNVLPEYIKFNKIYRHFACCFDNIKTIKENGPKHVGENYVLYVHTNKINFKEEDVRKFCEVKGDVIISQLI